MPSAPTTTEKVTESAKRQYLDVYDREHETTLRVLRAYPVDKLDLKPHAMCKNARELAWMFVLEQVMGEKLITTGFDPNAMPSPPPTPPTMDGIIAAFDDGHKHLARVVSGMSEDQLSETTKFFVAPKTIGDVQKMQVLWMLLHDQIHHRGQFSIYLRMADGKVPSIYGPTADEPWR